MNSENTPANTPQAPPPKAGAGLTASRLVARTSVVSGMSFWPDFSAHR